MHAEKIAVLGGGNGAHAMSADLTMAGYKINMYELPRFEKNIETTLKYKRIEITGKARAGTAEINDVTTDIEKALRGIDLVMIVVPAFGHRIFAEVCAQHLEDGQMVVLFAASAGSIEFANILKEKGVRKDVTIAETQTLPYGTRLIGPAKVHVFETIKPLPVAAFPAKDTNKVVDRLKEFYPVVAATNVLETALNNVNHVVHPTAVVLNAGYIEYSKEFYLYRLGVTPSVARVMEIIDEERLNICKALGLNHISIRDFWIKFLGRDPTRTLSEILIESEYKIFSLKERYVTEDVPYGLVLTVSLGDMLGVPTPVSRSIVELASVLNQTDYMKEGRTVESLGISGLSKEELNNFLAEGCVNLTKAFR